MTRMQLTPHNWSLLAGWTSPPVARVMLQDVFALHFQVSHVGPTWSSSGSVGRLGAFCCR